MKLLDGLYVVSRQDVIMVAREDRLVGGRRLKDTHDLFRRGITDKWRGDYAEKYEPKHLLLPMEFLD